MVVGYFRYVALNDQGEKTIGFLKKKTLQEAMDSLRSKNIPVISLKHYWTFGSMFWSWGVFRPSMGPFFFGLHCCLEGGQTLWEALETLGSSLGFPYGFLTQYLLENLYHGIPLSQGMKKEPKFFSPFVVAVVATGETCHELSSLCLSLSIHINNEHQDKKNLLFSLFYPLCCLGGALFLCWFFCVHFVFSDTFWDTSNDHGELIPRNNAPRVFNGLLINFLYQCQNHLQNHEFFSFFMNLCPLGIFLGALGFLFYKTLLEYFLYIHHYGFLFSSLGLLMDKKIPLLKSLEILHDSTSSGFLKSLTTFLRDSLKKGQSLCEALDKRKGPFLPPLVLSLLKTGEKTNNLIKSLQNSVLLLKGDLHKRKTFLLSCIGPCILVLTTLFLWTLLEEIFYPLYSLG